MTLLRDSLYPDTVDRPFLQRVVFDCYSPRSLAGFYEGFPDPANPAQLHIDYRFPDGAQAAIQRAERLGAIHMPPNEVTSQCYADPAGHPFCL